MKKILILTDFSENAAEAAELGVMFSIKLHANLLLFNSYSTYPVMVSYAGGPWIVDEFLIKQNHSKKQLNLIVEDLDNVISQFSTEEKRPTVDCLCGEGDVGSNVADIIDQKDIELIIMGARADKSDDHILFGHDTTSVIEKATRPVLIVSSKFDLKKVNKVIFATDFSDEDVKAIKYLVKLAKLFDYQLKIIHVNEIEKEEPAMNLAKISFTEQIAGLNYPGIAYHEIRGKDVITRLNRYCTETGAGLLAMVHQQESFFMRILRQSATKKALSDQKISLMIFPSRMD